MLADHLYYKLFAHCIPVKGANRSVICDLQRRTVDYIPNSMYDLLVENKSDSIGRIKQKYGKDNEGVIQEYFSFLIEKEFLFLCDQEELDLFPDLDLNWEVPNEVENAIIDAQENSQHDYQSIFQQLEDLGCVAVQIRNYFAEDFYSLKRLLDLLKNSRIESIEIISGFSESFSQAQIQQLADDYPRLCALTLHSAPSNNALELEHPFLNFSCTTQAINSHAHCGLVAPRFFSITLDAFLESQQHNSCLNHKIAIDALGQIKNCPSLPDAYGNIKTTTLREALNQVGFKKFWKLHKDQVTICRDCEFRHICTDCRAFVETPDDSYSKPLKCGYDPYINKWQDWTSHPMKAKAIEHYGLVNIANMAPVLKQTDHHL